MDNLGKLTPPRLLRETFSGRRVLVTGHTGFKGAWLCLWLHTLGAQVCGYALAPSTKPSLFEAGELSGIVQNINADVRDYDALKRAVEMTRPEIVFHLAAQSLVLESYNDPRVTFDTNVMGTVNLLEVLRHTNTAKVAIIVTSDKCYLNTATDRAYSEEDPLGGNDPYSASKACAELVTNAYRNSFFAQADCLSLSSVRAGNVIGGGDWAEHRIVPDAIRALTKDQPLVLRQPQSIRPWQYVLDPLAGYLSLAASMWENNSAFTGAWNFGPNGDAYSVIELIKRFFSFWGSGRYEIAPAAIIKQESIVLRVDSAKAQTKLPWRPVYSFDQALEDTALWYKNFYSNRDNVQKICMQQIAKYTARAQEKLIPWSLS